MRTGRDVIAHQSEEGLLQPPLRVLRRMENSMDHLREQSGHPGGAALEVQLGKTRYIQVTRKQKLSGAL